MAAISHLPLDWALTVLLIVLSCSWTRKTWDGCSNLPAIQLVYKLRIWGILVGPPSWISDFRLIGQCSLQYCRIPWSRKHRCSWWNVIANCNCMVYMVYTWSWGSACGVACTRCGSTRAFGSIGRGFESEHRIFSHHSASCFSKLRSLA